MRTLHVSLRVTDMERSIVFCTSVDYEVLGQFRAAESISLTMLKLPDDEFVSPELIHDRGHARVDSTGLSSPQMPCTDAPIRPAS